MNGVQNRVPHVICEVGICTIEASFTEWITVIPGDPRLKDERHKIDIALCDGHEEQFQRTGLAGIVTAYGDQIVAAHAA